MFILPHYKKAYFLLKVLRFFWTNQALVVDYVIT